MKFFVEGRYFNNTLWAFTFAQIQAARMGRPVEVRVEVADGPWHATAYPDNYKRAHVVKQPPGVMPLPAKAVANG